jgi:magnesium transporter
MPIAQARTEEDRVSAAEMAEAWRILSQRDRVEGFLLLPRGEAEELFFSLSAPDQAAIILGVPEDEQRSWFRLLAPDDAADVVQAAPAMAREQLLALLDDPTCQEVRGLLAYAEDRAGGLMNTRFARLRPEMTVDQALAYLRKQGRQQIETIYYCYVLASDQRLLGVVSFR